MHIWIDLLWIAIATPLGLLALYDAAVCLAGLKRPVEPPPAARRRRFAVLIAAHDEEEVIARNIESLGEQSYPRDHYGVFVVADHCSDRTAEEARRAGAEVVERDGEALARGKSPALRHLLEQIAAGDERFDAICTLDADNLASPNFLEILNRHLDAGEHCVQAYLDIKNPDDSWVTGAISVAYWTTNRLWQAARHRIGLSSALGGTGFAIEWELALRLAYRTECVTDDLELQMALVLDGKRVTWAHGACVYDEKPVTLQASWRQRLRWMRGHWDVAGRCFAPLLRRGLRRLDPVALDSALYLLQPLRTVVASGALATVVLTAGLGWSPAHFYWIFGALLLPVLSTLAHFCFFGLPGLGLWLERVPLRHWRFYPSAFLFGFTWIPIAAWGIATSGRREWRVTQHVRSSTVAEARARGRR